jgi:hypothetical protein
MDCWIKQSGHPLIHVKLLNKTAVHIKQEHFLFDTTLTVNTTNKSSFGDLRFILFLLV